MTKKHSGILILILVIFSLYFSSNAQTYGLKFNGFDVILDKRTEINLTSDDFLKFKDEFEISFDYKPDPKLVSSFGYIFRIIDENDFNVDLLSTNIPNTRLNLVIGKYNTIIPINNTDVSTNKWINIRVKFILSEDKLIFYTPDSFYVCNKVGFEKKDAFKIIFGANDYNQFKTTDVPSICLKDIKLYENGKLKYHWALAQKEGDTSIDRINNRKIIIKNAYWLIQTHQSWASELNLTLDGFVTTAVDVINEKIFLLQKEEFQVFLTTDKSLTTIKYKNTPAFFNSDYKAIFNNSDNKIYCYVVENDMPYISLDVASGEWVEQVTPSAVADTFFWHHNRILNPSDNSIYLFGGYGLFRYHNTIRRINLNTGERTSLITNDSIYHPKYLAAAGVLNDTVYILGGYGSESGNQLINPKSYYDLFGYSIKNGNFFKKFEIEHIKDDMVMANSLWIDPQNRDYYALVFEKNLFDGEMQLLKGNLNDSTTKLLGDKLPFHFLDTRSYAGLYCFAEQSKLYAYTTFLTDENKTDFSVYSISYPPGILGEKAYVAESHRFIWWIIIAVILVLTSIILLLFRKKREEVKSVTLSIPTDDEETISPKIDVRDIDFQMLFFGGFQIFDTDNNDVTNKFSPLLKELFLLILLNTLKNKKGISSDQITETLWFDKSEKSARNNRSVNIAKLRAILKEVGAIDISKKTGYWKFTSESKDFKSDYVDFLEITGSKTNLSKEKILKLIQITQKGAFLLNLSYEWLDDFKSEVSDKVIDTLVTFGWTCNVKQESDFIILLSDSIFNFDNVNEDAMILKCQAEYFMGKHSLAKATYDHFFREYKTLYTQEYSTSYLEILQINSTPSFLIK